MADPLLFPDNQAAAIRRLEERVRALESVNRILSTAIRDGALTVYDAAGQVQAILGLQPDGHYGLIVGASQPIPGLDVDNVDGMSYPELPIVWRDSPANTITAASLALYASTIVPVVSHKGIRVRVQCNTSPGTTGEVQLQRTGVGIATTTTATVTVPSDSFLFNVEFWWLHGGIIGNTYNFNLNARRASGAGTFNVTDPQYAYMVGPEHCSLAGTFVP